MKRSQIKMTENIAIIFVFSLLLMAGLVFYVRVKEGMMKDKQAAANDLESIEVAQRIAYLSEIRCTRDNVEVPNCIDALKAGIVAKHSARFPEDYFLTFGRTKVILRIVYPPPIAPDTGNLTIFDFACTDCKQHKRAFIPVSIYNPTAPTGYGFGYLDITLQLP
ncbi:MAG: hypothetical protein V1735_05075 [Nanoarchaeota archaeon]